MNIVPSSADIDTAERELGRGRCGVVLLGRAGDGQPLARKVFAPGVLTGLILRLCSGAPNPYVWNEDAVRAALLRRRILEPLLQLWLDGKARVATAFGYSWNEAHHAFELRREFVPGAHVALRHPLRQPREDDLRELITEIMQPLQRHLEEAGVHGMVWQAGRGNPVGLGNFLREAPRDSRPGCWVWIDLESGVPALFPANPLQLVRYYVPQALRLGRPLFDDVDTAALRRYVHSRSPELMARLGDGRVRALASDIDALAACQQRWKSQPWLHRSIAYRRARGDIDARQAAWHQRHPWGWWILELGRFMYSAFSGAGRLLAELASRLARIRLAAFLRAAWAFAVSQQYRLQLARYYVDARLGDWQRRGQMSAEEAGLLRAQLQAEEGSAYLADFAVHLMIKPVMKTLQWWVMPGLWLLGVIDERTLAMFLILGGGVVRTSYTLFRVVQNTVRGRERPWVALGAGLVPVIGNLAFPLQIVASARPGSLVAQFMVYDGLGRLGQILPVWGGCDTYTEHLFNRCADRVVGWRTRRGASIPQAGEELP